MDGGMNGQTDTWTDRQTDGRPADGQADRWTFRQTGVGEGRGREERRELVTQLDD